MCKRDTLEVEMLADAFRAELEPIEVTLFEYILAGYSDRYIIDKTHDKHPDIKPSDIKKRLNYVRGAWERYGKTPHTVSA